MPPSQKKPPVDPRFPSLLKVGKRNRDNDQERSAWRKVAIIQAYAILLLAGGVFFAVSGIIKGTNTYFGLTADHRLVRLHALEEPLLAAADIRDFALKVATRTFSYDFVHALAQVEELRDDYSKEGYRNVRAELERIGLLKTIQDERLVTAAVPTAAPIIVAEVLDSRDKTYKWRVQIPMALTLEGEKSRRSQQLKVSLDIARASELEKVRGVAAERIEVQ